MMQQMPHLVPMDAIFPQLDQHHQFYEKIEESHGKISKKNMKIAKF
jgi:hypothetical protein